jgi:DNA-binding beta-propeller fold protein YncE
MSERCRFLRDVAVVAVIAALLSALWPCSSGWAQSIIATVELPECGYGVGVSPDGSLVYVGMRGKLAIVDASSHAVVTIVPLTDSNVIINAVAVNQGMGHIYAGGSSIYVVDAASRVVLTRLPYEGSELEVNETSNVFYATETGFYIGEHDLMRVFDGATQALLQTFDYGSSYDYEWVYLAWNPRTNLAYSSYTRDGSLHIISGETHAELTHVGAAKIGDVIANPTTNEVYLRSDWRALVLDGSSHEQIGTVPGFAGELLVDPVANHLFSVSKPLSDWLLRIADGNTHQKIGEIVLPDAAYREAVDPLLHRIYLTTYNNKDLKCQTKMLVVQDIPAATATPTASATPSRTPTQTPTATRGSLCGIARGVGNGPCCVSGWR